MYWAGLCVRCTRITTECMCAGVYVCALECMYVRWSVCMCAEVYVCALECMYVRWSVCMCAGVYMWYMISYSHWCQMDRSTTFNTNILFAVKIPMEYCPQ